MRGGVARCAFYPASEAYGLEQAENEVDEAIAGLTKATVATVVANVGSANTTEFSDRLLHITRPDASAGNLDFSSFVVDWASQAVQQKYLAKGGELNFIEACGMLWESNHVNSSVGLGYLAENITHHFLTSQKLSLVGSLLPEEAGYSVPGESRNFNFEPSTKVWFSSIEDLTQLMAESTDAQLCKLYLQPVQSNYPAIDSLSFRMEPDAYGRQRLLLRLLQITTEAGLPPIGRHWAATRAACAGL